ncbi:MAG: LysE family transporter [Bacteroidales bacterium]|nr:LysE family transporter [Bacteroidales bacterium]
MDPILVIKGIIIGFLAACPIGAVAILCIHRTISNGFWPGLVMGIGSAFGDFVYAIITGFSISFISDFLTSHRTILGIIGGILMICLGIKIIRTHPAKQMREQRSKTYKNKFFNDFMASFALTVSNPLTIIAFSGLFMAAGSVSISYLETTITLAGVILGAMLWWLLLVSIINIFRKKVHLRHILWINRITGTCVCIFGTSIILLVTVFTDKL